MLSCYYSIREPMNYDYYSGQYETDDEFIIAVKPRKRKFQSDEEKTKFIEEFTKKKKTELCKTFMITGYCRFENTCSYAHGLHELVPKTHLHDKYKTKQCSSYFQDGYCRYGLRCQYSHEQQKNNSTTNTYKKLNQKAFIQQSKNDRQENKDSYHEQADQNFINLQKKYDIDVELFVNPFQSRLNSLKRLTQSKANKKFHMSNITFDEFLSSE